MDFLLDTNPDETYIGGVNPSPCTVNLSLKSGGGEVNILDLCRLLNIKTPPLDLSSQETISRDMIKFIDKLRLHMHPSVECIPSLIHPNDVPRYRENELKESNCGLSIKQRKELFKKLTNNPNLLEGRNIQVFINELCTANRSFKGTNKKNIYDLIINMEKGGVVRLSTDKSRFGITIPLARYKIPHDDDELITKLWEELGTFLLAVKTFFSAVNVIINSSTFLKDFCHEEARSIAGGFVIRFLQVGFLR